MKKRKDVGTNHSDHPNAFIECSNTKNDVYQNIDDYYPGRKRKILIVFDDIIAHIMSNKKFQAIILELFIRCRKLNICLQKFYDDLQRMQKKTIFFFDN